MRGTFGLGRILKQSLSAKGNKKVKNTKNNLDNFNSPEIQILQKEKDKLLEEENIFLEKIDAVNVDTIKLKNQINELQIKRKKLKTSTLVSELKDFKNRLNNETNKEKDEKNVKKINSIKNKIEEINKKLFLNSKRKKNVADNIFDTNESIKINEEKIEIFNAEIKSIKIKIAAVEKKITDEIEIQDTKNSKIRRRKVFYSLLFPIFLFVNLQNNTENSSNQSTNLDEVSNQEMEKVIELNPDIMPTRIALANRYFEAFDYSSALPHFMYVAENSNDIDLKSLSLSQIGWMVYEAGDINTSLNYINEALRISPKSLLAETYKGIILIQQTDTRDEGILILNSLRNNPSLSEEDLSIIEEILEIYES